MYKLIVFIDALPYEYRENFKNFSHKQNLKINKLTPGYGFSSNQHNMLLRGLLPDKVGFFTDYEITEKKFGHYLRHDNWINFIFRKIQSRLGFNFANIPMGMGHRFRRNCIYPLKSKNNLDTLCEEYLDYDFYVDDKAMNFLNDKFINQNTFLVFNHIDHLGHYKGVNSDDYKKSVKHLIDELGQFLDTNKCEILLFSDHGMSVRPKKTSLVLEDYFGKQSLDKYNYFIDSTTLRVWVYDDLLKEKIIQTLSKKKYGLIIDDKKRKEYGIANPKFGHIIFVLSNDYFFEPHYFGFGLKSKTLGMHGNIPTDKWQIGLWMGSEKLPDCFDSRLFYNDIMKKFLKV